MIERHQPDIVEFHHLNTAIYRPFVGECHSILREHNIEYKVWERFGEVAEPVWERAYLRWSAPRVRRYEARAARNFDRCVVVTPCDAEYLRLAAPRARIEVIPSGVDTEYFHPAPEIDEEPFSITITGSFEWKPKRQSLFVLLTDAFPRIKAKVEEAKLYVVGKGIPEAFQRVAERTPGVTLIGAVPDVRPYIWRSSLVINYLESGGGIALKVLEAMAMRKAVLANALGCEGLQVTHGRDIFIAHGPAAFADAAVQLLKDQSLRRNLSEGAYATALKLYSWHAIADQFLCCYEKVLDEAKQKKALVELAASHCRLVESSVPRAAD
jgi:glycosyltransferase involved in cell wall biosynthesis